MWILLSSQSEGLGKVLINTEEVESFVQLTKDKEKTQIMFKKLNEEGKNTWMEVNVSIEVINELLNSVNSKK